MTDQGEQPTAAAILEAWEAIVLDRAPNLEDLDGRSLQARAQVAALELHVEVLNVCTKVLRDLVEEEHAVAAESLERTLVTWELVSSRLPECDGLEALLVDGLSADEYHAAMAILADELIERRREEGCP